MNTNTDVKKQEKRHKVTKMLKWTAIVAVGLIVVAVTVGVCNALFAKGNWTFGWKNYRYDDSLYEIGGGTVPFETVTSIDIDWVDGIVQVIPCDDRYISLTEHSEIVLSEEGTVRWNVSADGSALSVKYRASSWFLGEGSNKNLTLRIPRRMLAQLQSVRVTATTANILLMDLQSESLSVTTENGGLRAIDCRQNALQLTTKNGSMTYESATCPRDAQIEAEHGEITLAFPMEANFTLYWGEDIVSDLPITKKDGCYVCGTGAAQLRVTSKKSGTVTLKEYQPK